MFKNKKFDPLHPCMILHLSPSSVLKSMFINIYNNLKFENTCIHLSHEKRLWYIEDKMGWIAWSDQLMHGLITFHIILMSFIFQDSYRKCKSNCKTILQDIFWINIKVPAAALGDPCLGWCLRHLQHAPILLYLLRDICKKICA